MSSPNLIVALDSGSQSSRALLFDLEGRVLCTGTRAHQPMLHPEPGAVEQDPHDIRDCLIESVRECVETWGGDPSNIAAAALTTQRSTMLLVDEEGAPLGDAMSWLDRRVASVESEPSAAVRFGLKMLGEASLIPRLLQKSWPRVWRERAPESLSRAASVTSVEGWLHHQLVGRTALAPGGVVGPWPFDIKKRAWSESRLLAKLLGFERRWLPDIVEAGQQVGRLSQQAAEQTGLPEGLPFFACGGDKQAEALGAGVRAAAGNIAAVSLGTGSSISIPWPKPVQSSMYRWLTMASAEPGSWSHEYLLFRGMWTARWFALNFARDLESKAAETNQVVEALLCAEAEKIPAGSDGLVIWPRWSPTLQYPSETGTCVGLRETHTRGHFFRALLEGIGFDLRRGLGILERALGTRVAEIRVGGGGARSPQVVQILADILGLPVRRPESKELSARGAAIVAAVGSGLHPSYEHAVGAMVADSHRVEPTDKDAATYRKIYRDVFLPGLRMNRNLSKTLHATTAGG